MSRISLIFLSLILASFIVPEQSGTYLFVMHRPIASCDGKCNNYEVVEYVKKTAEECKKQEDSCKVKYGVKAEYMTIAPGEAAIFYKYNKFVANCDCKIKGIHKAATVAKATEEMNLKITEERLKKPKAFHNYEVYATWPR